MSQHEIQIQLSGLIQLLANNLYADPDVFVREMIQNAHDSITRRREVCDADAPLGRIDIEIDSLEGTIRFRDNGAGMTEQELHDYLSTIGRSGTGELKQTLREQNHARAAELIGQFGIGLLSAFTAAHTVEVRTRSCRPGQGGLLWRSEGDKEYLVEPIERESIGSEVTLYIKETHRDMLDPRRIQEAVKLYADFIEIPIHIDGDPQPANTIKAPWDREDEYTSEMERIRTYQRFIDERVPDAVMEVIPVVVDEPLRVRGVLYVSSRRRPDIDIMGTVDLYISRMFIAKEHTGILPPWAKFIRGIIECPDVNPNAARDNVTKDERLTQLQAVLGQVIIDHLRGLAERDPGKLIRLMDYHHYHIKGMALENEDFFDAIADMVPFETNKGFRALPEYLSGQGDELVIRYFSERGAGTQIYMLCEAQGMEVINGSFTFEERFLKRYAEKHNIRLERLDIAGSKTLFPELDEDELARFSELEKEFAFHLRHLNVHPVLTAFQPATLPVVLTASKILETRKAIKEATENDALPQAVRQLLKQLSENEEDEVSAPLTLYINTRNETIQTLVNADLRSEAAQLAFSALYNNAVMMSSHLQTPENAKTIAATANRVIHRFVKQGLELQQVRRRLGELKKEQASQPPTDHVTCFVAIPFDSAYDPLMEKLQDHFEAAPYFWEVLRADQRYEQDGRGNIDGHIRTHMSAAHLFFAEISEANANVMIEVGRMQMMDKPLFYLQWQEGAETISDLDGRLFVRYDKENPASVIEALERFKPIKKIKGTSRFLSRRLLERAEKWEKISEKGRNYLLENFTTLEEVENAGKQGPENSPLESLEWDAFWDIVQAIKAGNGAMNQGE